MQHPFSALAPEYTQLLQSMVVAKQQAVASVADKLLSFVRQGRYAQVSAATGVPQVWMATSFEREASSNFALSPAQGDRWDRVSVHVPRGRGPFPDWATAAKDAYAIDGLDKIGAGNWTMERACYEGEIFNGMGYRAHGVHSPYLWAGTNIYSVGKYVADGVWDPNHADTQLGIVPVMLRMIALDPSISISAEIVSIKGAPSIVPAPQPAPVGVGGGEQFDTKWVQHFLNQAGYGPLIEDGNYGRRTRNAVLAFQKDRLNLDDDGLVGAATLAEMKGTAV